MEFFKNGARGTNEKVVEGVHYVTHTNKDGYKIRVYNMENADLCRRTGVIDLEPVRKSGRHDNRLLVTTLYDRENDIIIGIPMGTDPKTGDLKFKRINVGEGRTFDLTNNNDAMEWAVLKHHPDIDVDGSKTRIGSKTLKYKVYDKELIASKKLAERPIRRKAIEIAEGLHGQQLKDFAVNLGIPVDQMSTVELEVKVIEFAEDYSKRFMEIWDNPNLKETTIIKKALNMGILELDMAHGITYNTLSIGVNEQSAVQYLKDNINMFITIERAVEARSGKVSDTEKPTSKIADANSAEVERLRNELEALKKQYAVVNSLKVEELAEKTATEIISSGDEEYAELLAEAKTLKIKGAHRCNKELLKQKVEEAKALVKN